MRPLIIMFSLLFILSPAPAQWSPIKSPIMTVWGEQINPDSVLSEYPRPHMVRENWINLNGIWLFSLTDTVSGRPTGYDSKILVPFCVESTLGGVTKKVTAENAMWYSRELPLEQPMEGERILLHFGAVDWHCMVWVNDEPVGEHYGGYDPFSFDITEALNKNGKQTLTLRVWDPTNEGLQPRGKQLIEPRGIWYTPVSGIWQTVWLEQVESGYISDVVIVPDIDQRLVNVAVELSEAGPLSTIHIQVLEDSSVISSLTVKPGDNARLEIPDAKLWSPQSPFLYDVKIEVFNTREIPHPSKRRKLISEVIKVDEVSSYFGMRKVEIRKDKQGFNRIFLNNKELFNYGPLDQGWWPDGLYTAPSDEALKYDIEVTKSLGFNTARKHTKVEPARWYYWCDVLGLMVWQDMPRCDGGLSPAAEEDVLRPPELEKIYFREWEAIIRAFDHHPSIICWVPFNEGWGQFRTNEVLDWTKSLDPTRLVDGPSGWKDFGGGDMLDIHFYPGPGMGPLQEDRAVVLGEFGGLKYVQEGHLWQADKNWGYQNTESPEDLNRSFEKLLTDVNDLIPKGLAAAIYTQTSDVEIEVNGLMTYDRRVVKLDQKRASAAAAKLYAEHPVYKFLLPCSEQQDSIEWRYTTQAPSGDWFAVDLDDAGWESGIAGFGYRGRHRVFGTGTVWDTTVLWMRRDFELQELPEGKLMINFVSYNSISAIYINGKKLAVFSPSKDFHQLSDFDNALKKLLRPGTNNISVYTYAKDPPYDEREGKKRQYADFGIIEVID
ncbi:MAG TPA: beta-galactosidase [Bacteroides sp.]|nr:beta-galactosidase [Bacteroides sp.]